jgi:hypothetical protein
MGEDARTTWARVSERHGMAPELKGKVLIKAETT